MAENSAEVKIGADVDDAVDAFTKLSQTLGDVNSQITESFKTLEKAAADASGKLKQAFKAAEDAAGSSASSTEQSSRRKTKALSDEEKAAKAAAKAQADAAKEAAKAQAQAARDAAKNSAAAAKAAAKAEADAVKAAAKAAAAEAKAADKAKVEAAKAAAKAQAAAAKEAAKAAADAAKASAAANKKAEDAAKKAAKGTADSGKKTEKAFKDTEKAAKQAASGAKKSLDSIDKEFKETANGASSAGGKFGAGIGGMAKSLLALAAAYLTVSQATAAFQKGIDVIKEVDGVALRLNMSAETASVYRQAVRDAGLEMSTFENASKKLQETLGQNEEKLNQLGVVTRDSSGALLDQEKVLQNALSTVGKYKDGTDRAEAAQEIFGTDLDETNKLLQLQGENLENARKRAEAFGMVFSDDTAQMVQEFKDSMGLLKTATEGVAATLAEKLLPVIINLANFVTGTLKNNMGFFEELGSTIAMVLSDMFEIGTFVFDGLTEALNTLFKDTGVESIRWQDIIEAVMGAIKIAVIAVMAGVQSLVEIFSSASRSISIWVNLIIDQWNALKRFDWTAAQVNAKRAFDAIAAEGEILVGKLASVAARARAQVEGVLTTGGIPGAKNLQTGAGLQDITSFVRDTTPMSARGGGTRAFVAPKSGGGGKKDNSAEEAEREARKLLEAQFNYRKQLFENEAALREAQYDRELAALESMLQEGLVSQKDYYARVKAIEQEKTATEIKSREMQIEEIDRLSKAAKFESERVKLSTDRLKVEGEIAVLKEKQAAKDEELIRREREALKAEREEIQRLEYETKKSQLETRLKSSGAADWVADKERNALQREYNSLLLEQARAELAAAEASGTASELKLAQLRAQVAALEEATTEANEFAKAINNQISDGMTEMLESIANGTKSVKDAVIDFFNDLAKTITKLVAEMLMQQMVGGLVGGNKNGSSIGGFISSLFGAPGSKPMGGGAAGGGGGGGFFSSLGSMFSGMFGGGKWGGGKVSRGMSYVVGEKGKEIFVPNQSGTVLTADQTKALLSGGRGNGGQTINMTVITPDANSFNSSKMQIQARTAQAVARANSRNN